MQDGFILDQMKLELKIKYHIWVSHRRLELINGFFKDLNEKKIFDIIIMPNPDYSIINKYGITTSNEYQSVFIYPAPKWINSLNMIVVFNHYENQFKHDIEFYISRNIAGQIPSFEKWLELNNVY